MSHVTWSLSRSAYLRVCALGLALTVLPAATAFAQTLPQMRMVSDREISTFRHFGDDHYVITTAASGTVLDVIYTEGDAFRHLESNWYWVLLPRDQWGTKRAGWISGRYVQPVPPAPRAQPASAPVEAPRHAAVNDSPAQPVAQPEAAPAAPAAPEMPEFAAVMVHFAFDKSDLTDEAKTTLNEAVSLLKTQSQGVVVALEGHADATGRESYNDKLGQARADRVKQYLAEQHQIAVEKITVVSYGEKQPTASNGTREGRAQNRRVVLKVGR